MGRRPSSHLADDIVSFPWPPPTPTTQAVLDRTLLAQRRHAWRRRRAVDHSAGGAGLQRAQLLSRARRFRARHEARADRVQRYAESRAAALVSRAAAARDFSLGGFIDALFSAPEGHYRVIVFVVNDQPFSTTGRL